MTEKDRIDKIFRAVRNELANLGLDYMTPNSVATVVKQIIKSHLPKKIDREAIEALREKREDRNYTYIREHNAVGEFIQDIDILLSKDKDGE